MLISNYNKVLVLDEDILTQVESIAYNMQRVSKLELEDNSDDELIKVIDELCDELLLLDLSILGEDNAEILNILQSNIDYWEQLKIDIVNFHNSENRRQFFEASEVNYNSSMELVEILNYYVDKHDKKADKIRATTILNILLIGIVLGLLIYNSTKEMKESRELSKNMYIDASTGVYNSAKCQEILKTQVTKTNKHRAVIIFDLNDLKKTNDNLGHRAGDQLIYDFAQQVNNASDKFDYKIFVGRYGGDEFMAFINDIENQDVINYISEVNNLIDEFNKTEEREYRVSCAIGYGITTEETRHLTNKDLFDIADENMYKNKIAMKNKKK